MTDLERIETVFSSKHWRWLYLAAEDCPRTLVEALSSNLPHVASASWAARLEWGGAFVNGKPAAADVPLTPPCKVEYYEPRFDIEKADAFFPPYSAEYVLFEDPELIVAFKPAGLPTMPAKEQKRYSFKAYMERYTGGAVHLPSRLDMSTAGLVALSKSPRMHNPLQRLFERRRIEKHYLLQVTAPVCWRTLETHAAIGKSPDHPVLRSVSHSGGQEALTFFRRVHADGECAILEARPKTGRTHQIRVHISHAGWPIVGDAFYGGAPAPRLRLLSWRIAFPHPSTGARIDVLLPERFRPDWLPAHVLESIS